MAGSYLPGPRPRAEEAGRAEPLGCCARPGRAGGGALVDQTGECSSPSGPGCVLGGGWGDGSCPPGGSTRPGRALEAGPVTSVCGT